MIFIMFRLWNYHMSLNILFTSCYVLALSSVFKKLHEKKKIICPFITLLISGFREIVPR